MKHLASSPTPQRGFTLLEALVSLIILALGVLGLAAMQGRMLVDTRTTNGRAAAIRLIGELGERIRLNAAGALPPEGGVSLYAEGDGATVPAGSFQSAPAAPLPNDCSAKVPPTTPCTAAQQAAYDVASWRQAVAAALPNGRARIWQVSPRQLQVVISWQANENTQATLNTGSTASNTTQVTAAMQIVADATGSATDNQCGASSTNICHIDFIDIPPNQ